MNVRAILLSCLLLVLFVTACSAATEYRVNGLQITILDNGSAAYGINNNGIIVGEQRAIRTQACYWLNGVIKSAAIPNTTASHMQKINDNGAMVGYVISAGNTCHPVLRDTQGNIKIFEYSGEALSINNYGQIAGYVNDSGTGNKPAVWDSSGNFSRICDFYGYAFDINSSGQTVGFYFDASNVRHAFLWDKNNGLTDLDERMGITGGLAYGINDLGQVVGYYKDRAFFWSEATGRVDIGPFSNYNRCAARDINNHGQVVGASSGGAGYSRAFLWSYNGGMVDIGGFVGGNTDAYAINNSGQVVGWLDFGPNLTAITWNPVPEPSSLAALLCGFGSMGGFVWRKKR